MYCPHRQAGKCCNRIHTTGGEHDHAGFPALEELEDVHRAQQVVLDQPPRAGIAINPASKLGLAAASVTQSIEPMVSRSDALRRSACRTYTSSDRSRSRLRHEPRRDRLSMPMISRPGRPEDSSRADANSEPTKPHAPRLLFGLSRDGLSLPALARVTAESTPDPALFLSGTPGRPSADRGAAEKAAGFA